MEAEPTVALDPWRALPAYELDRMSTEGLSEVAAGRVRDLFERTVTPDPRSRMRPAQVSQSQGGVERMRAFVMDSDADLGYSEQEYHAGVVKPDERGRMYA